MFSPVQIKGLCLPKKVLCLTFDDGPGETPGNSKGPNTLKLAGYLHQQKVFATFFMVGESIAGHPHIVAEVVKLGHIVGNHTYSHPNMRKHFIAGKDVLKEIRMTDELIHAGGAANPIFFRAPFGDWLPELSHMLNENLPDHIEYKGPFHWDIECGDWAFWREDMEASICAEFYLKEVLRVKRGIVLMHDSSANMEAAKTNNRTLETIQLLIPRLKRRGFKFIRLDEVLQYLK